MTGQVIVGVIVELCGIALTHRYLRFFLFFVPVAFLVLFPFLGVLRRNRRNFRPVIFSGPSVLQ